MKSLSQKREEAMKREEERSKLSAKEQIQKLDNKYGKGVGSVRERARLNKLIEKESK